MKYENLIYKNTSFQHMIDISSFNINNINLIISRYLKIHNCVKFFLGCIKLVCLNIYKSYIKTFEKSENEKFYLEKII
jgi:hypothetical protein